MPSRPALLGVGNIFVTESDIPNEDVVMTFAAG